MKYFFPKDIIFTPETTKYFYSGFYLSIFFWIRVGKNDIILGDSILDYALIKVRISVILGLFEEFGEMNRAEFSDKSYFFITHVPTRIRSLAK